MGRTCGCGGRWISLSWVPTLAASIRGPAGDVVWSGSWYTGRAYQDEGFCLGCGARWVISPMTEAPETIVLDEADVRVPGGPLVGGASR